MSFTSAQHPLELAAHLARLVEPETAKPTIFVVDHDAAVRDALSISLVGYGYATRTYSSGKEFLRALHPSHRGCLLIEFDLQDMKATDLVASLVTKRIELPAIVMSVRLRKPALADRLPTGIVDFLQKPFGQDEMLARLHRAMGKLDRHSSRI